MISVRTLVRLGLTLDDWCTKQWSTRSPGVARTACRATKGVHRCVGDLGHGGKHVCCCGALRSVHSP